MRAPPRPPAHFLLASRDRDGRWRDFNTRAGASDEWVTAYVGAAIASLPYAECAIAARAAWTVLRRRRWWARGFGYNGRVPADADSTAWALRLAAAVGEHESGSAGRARDFLREHQRPSGLVCTFGNASRIRRFTRIGTRISFQGWCAGHVCVTAAAAGFVDGVEVALCKRQDADGAWHGYWWCDQEYTTSLACEAVLANTTAVAAAGRWLLRRFDSAGPVTTATNPEGSAFASAWALRALSLAPLAHESASVVARGVDWLLRTQRADGSWPPSAALRIPPPGVTDPDAYGGWRLGGLGSGSIILDRRALFTTASVVHALAPLAFGPREATNVIA